MAFVMAFTWAMGAEVLQQPRNQSATSAFEPLTAFDVFGHYVTTGALSATPFFIKYQPITAFQLEGDLQNTPHTV